MHPAGSWSYDACCAVHGNDCHRNDHPSSAPEGYCFDRASSSDWLFGLWPGPPQRFEPTGTETDYRYVQADSWPHWGDLDIGLTSGAPGGEYASCLHGDPYRGTAGQICRGALNWGATALEVSYPRGH